MRSWFATCAILIALFILIQPQVISSDLFAYWSATSLLEHVGNPYSTSQLLQFQQQFRSAMITPEFVWNPPIFFLLYQVIFAGSLQYVGIAAAILRAACVASMILVTQLIIKPQKPLQVFDTLFITICTVPIFVETRVGQISSSICAIYMIAALLFTRRQFFWAGLTLNFCLIKPHVVLFPAIFLVCTALQQRNRSFFVGAVVGLSVAAISAEFCWPGIWNNWWQRDAWPSPIVGSTWSALSRAAVFHLSHLQPNWLIFVVPILGLSYLLLRAKSQLEPSHELMLWIVANSFFAPYGFVFDQSLLIVPLTYQFIRIKDESSRESRVWLLVLCLSAWLTSILPREISFSGIYLWWYTYPIVFLIWWIAAEKRKNHRNTESRN